uniref:ODV-E66 n=1 Tax=Strongyloides venezuelensis TaxID=75913 RepID=A0A0K0FRI8_STRVS
MYSDEKYGNINSVINGNFFAFQRTQDTSSKKRRYLLNDSQTLTVTKAFYEYLIKTNINNYENGVKMKFKRIVNLLKVLQNVTYLFMECDMEINECSRLCEYNVNKVFEYLYKVFSSDLKLTLKIHNLTHYPWNILRLKLLPVNFSCIRLEGKSILQF